mmetsp:Transcript_10407/g.19120  ORF Transcript_10407/g.19120 Transcript_10407/m.19120 type:complete len:221 (-) Transcript_10407:259-921(-)
MSRHACWGKWASSPRGSARWTRRPHLKRSWLAGARSRVTQGSKSSARSHKSTGVPRSWREKLGSVACGRLNKLLQPRTGRHLKSRRKGMLSGQQFSRMTQCPLLIATGMLLSGICGVSFQRRRSLCDWVGVSLESWTGEIQLFRCITPIQLALPRSKKRAAARPCTMILAAAQPHTWFTKTYLTKFSEYIHAVVLWTHATNGTGTSRMTPNPIRTEVWKS